MNFDLSSMKQRAKSLMSKTTPSPYVVGVILGVIAFAYAMLQCFIMVEINTMQAVLYVLIVELIYINFRTSMHWYCLKVTREEATKVSDAFLAFKTKQIKALFVGIIKEICIGMGICLFMVLWIFPFYWFRFATYVIYDDDSIGVFAALGKSMRLLKGHYGELIKLDISNIGWFLLAYCTCGLACVYVKPYTTLVYAEFYDYLKGQAELFGD